MTSRSVLDMTLVADDSPTETDTAASCITTRRADTTRRSQGDIRDTSCREVIFSLPPCATPDLQAIRQGLLSPQPTGRGCLRVLSPDPLQQLNCDIQPRSGTTEWLNDRMFEPCLQMGKVQLVSSTASIRVDCSGTGWNARLGNVQDKSANDFTVDIGQTNDAVMQRTDREDVPTEEGGGPCSPKLTYSVMGPTTSRNSSSSPDAAPCIQPRTPALSEPLQTPSTVQQSNMYDLLSDATKELIAVEMRLTRLHCRAIFELLLGQCTERLVVPPVSQGTSNHARGL